MKQVQFSKDAKIEFEAAVNWYESEQPGLGFRLIECVEAAIQLLRQPNPRLVPVAGLAHEKGAQQLILHKFPYSLIVFEKNHIFHIVALAHHSRKPGYWRERE